MHYLESNSLAKLQSVIYLVGFKYLYSSSIFILYSLTIYTNTGCLVSIVLVFSRSRQFLNSTNDVRINEFGLRLASLKMTIKLEFPTGVNKGTGFMPQTLIFVFLYLSVYPNLAEEGCQQSFLSLLRERALCALYLYRSLDIKVTSLHN